MEKRDNIKSLTENELLELAKKFSLDILLKDIQANREDIENEIADILFEGDSGDDYYNYLSGEVNSHIAEFLKFSYNAKAQEMIDYSSGDVQILALAKSRKWIQVYWDLKNTDIIESYKNKFDDDFKLVLRIEKLKKRHISIEQEIEIDEQDNSLSIYISDHGVFYRASLIIISNESQLTICTSNLVKVSKYGVFESTTYAQNRDILLESGIDIVSPEFFAMEMNFLEKQNQEKQIN